MLIQSLALEKVISEFGSEEKITQLNRDIIPLVLQLVIYVIFLSLMN
jgi:hypothetical protein